MKINESEQAFNCSLEASHFTLAFSRPFIKLMLLSLCVVEKAIAVTVICSCYFMSAIYCKGSVAISTVGHMPHYNLKIGHLSAFKCKVSLRYL